jgi:putative two-component system response regulator
LIVETKTRHSRKRWRLRSRSSLIMATVLLQAVVIGLGWWGTMQLTRVGLGSRVRERIVDESSRAVTHLAGALARADTKTDPDEAQRLVEHFRLPGRTTMAVLDEQGVVKFHPDIDRQPGLEGADLGGTPVTLSHGNEVILLRDLRPGTVVTGRAVLFGRECFVSVRRTEKLGGKIVAYQPVDGVEQAEDRFVRGVMLWLGVAGIAVLGLTVFGSAYLVRQYDTALMRFNVTLNTEAEDRTKRGMVIRNAMVFGLAKLADYRDTDTGKHLERICGYCELLSRELVGVHPEIDRVWIERLRLASSMHDIGKVGIPDSILLKPGAFTPSERRLMEQHATIGADTLIAIRDRVGDDDLLNMSIQVALSHHEKWDGTGYPSGLVGEQIPLCARIVALADMYDALTSKRVYKDAMSHGKAREIILANRGSHFDPAIVDAFERCEERFDIVRQAGQPETDAVELSFLQRTVAEVASMHRSAA